MAAPHLPLRLRGSAALRSSSRWRFGLGHLRRVGDRRSGEWRKCSGFPGNGAAKIQKRNKPFAKRMLCTKPCPNFAATSLHFACTSVRHGCVLVGLRCGQMDVLPECNQRRRETVDYGPHEENARNFWVVGNAAAGDSRAPSFGQHAQMRAPFCSPWENDSPRVRRRYGHSRQPSRAHA